MLLLYVNSNIRIERDIVMWVFDRKMLENMKNPEGPKPVSASM